MRIEGQLADYKTGAPITGSISIARDGQTVLTLDTTSEGAFIIDDLIESDEITVSAPNRKAQTFLVSTLSNTNTFYLSRSVSVIPIAITAAAALYAVSSNKKKVGEIKPGQIILIGGAVLGFSVVHKILVKLGIFKGKDTNDLDNEATEPDSAWSPFYYHNKPANVPWTYTINTPTATAYSKDLYDSFGAFNDCEECAKAVIKRCRTKANVSFLAEVFSNVYGQDLLSFLRGGYWPQDRLSDADVNELNQYIKNLPNY